MADRPRSCFQAEVICKYPCEPAHLFLWLVICLSSRGYLMHQRAFFFSGFSFESAGDSCLRLYFFRAFSLIFITLTSGPGMRFHSRVSSSVRPGRLIWILLCNIFSAGLSIIFHSIKLSGDELAKLRLVNSLRVILKELSSPETEWRRWRAKELIIMCCRLKPKRNKRSEWREGYRIKKKKTENKIHIRRK